MGLILWSVALLTGALAGWLILRRPIRQLVEERPCDRVRTLFRHRREWLEADFLRELGKLDPLERLRWEQAQWHDEIFWARDRRTRRLLALVGVHFLDSCSDDEFPDPTPRHATALFEFRKGRWHAEGKRLDEIRPQEAVLRGQRFEPAILDQPRRSG